MRNFYIKIGSAAVGSLCRMASLQMSGRGISSCSYWLHKDIISIYRHAARIQGFMDCDFITNGFLVANKPKHREAWWQRVTYGCNGSTHRSTLIRSGQVTEYELIGAWESYGQVKIKANNIAISVADSLNGRGTRFLKRSFHCINVVKIFYIQGEAYALSYDPEGNCGVAEVEMLNEMRLACTEPRALGCESDEVIQYQCAMYRVDLISELIGNADMLSEPSLVGGKTFTPSLGLYVAKYKSHLSTS